MGKYFWWIGTAQLIGSPVLTEAHLIGAIGGLFCGLGYSLLRRIEEQQGLIKKPTKK